MIETSPYIICTAVGQNPIAIANDGGKVEPYPPFVVSWRGTSRTLWETEATRRGATLPAVTTIAGFAAATTYGVLKHADGRALAWRLPAGGMLTFDARTWRDDVSQTSDYAVVVARCTALGIAPPAR